MDIARAVVIIHVTKDISGRTLCVITSASGPGGGLFNDHNSLPTLEISRLYFIHLTVGFFMSHLIGSSYTTRHLCKQSVALMKIKVTMPQNGLQCVYILRLCFFYNRIL